MNKSIRPMTLGELEVEPLVSVLIANYNYGRFLHDTFEGIFSQTYRHLEICICDDGSTDQSQQVIQGYADRYPCIKYRFQKNMGMATALNSAFSLAAGGVIALLDADDVWLPNKVERVVETFKSNNQAGMVIHPNRVVSGDLKEIYADRAPTKLASGWCGDRLMNGELIEMPPCSGLAVRREVAQRIFPLNPGFRAQADGVFREYAALLSYIESIDSPLTLMRMHGENITTTGSNSTDLLKVKANAELFRLRLRERARFISREFGLEVTTDVWGCHEGVIWPLAESLLTNGRLDPVLLNRVRSPLRKLWWRFLFACPFPLNGAFLKAHWSAPNPIRAAGMRQLRKVIGAN